MSTEKGKEEYKYIVGIGASAGGLEALQKLLTALPPNTGFPYIIIQHLSPDYKSILSQILGKYTQMPVIQAEEGMEIEKDHVYIIQPGKIMTLQNGRLHLTDQIPKELNLPINRFFMSLAEEAGSRAIAVVLSGTGSDGTNGIKSIKENDGLVITQDLESCKFDGMPRSAIRTGLVDAQITPEEIALELEHISGVAVKTQQEEIIQEVDEELMKRVYAILKKASNINFTHYKQTTITRRLERRMMLTHKDTLSDYVNYLYETPDEVRVLSKEVLIGVTNFFRDPESFQILKEKVIPDILSNSVPDEPVRAWVAGCSTGEEAYSIAILFSEVLESLDIKRQVKIFATDLDTEAIETASKGIYGDNIIDSVSPARLLRYFTRQNNTYVINRDIRRMIVFSPHNVFQDPPFGRLDLISCRNVLIYFQTILQNDLFAIFHQALKDGGYLFLGKSEAINQYSEAFPTLDSAAKIFSHRRNVKIAGAKKIPFFQTANIDDDSVYTEDGGISRISSIEAASVEEECVNTKLLQKFMPGTIVVNERNEIVYTLGDISNYAHLALGKFSNNLFDVMTEGMKIPVSTLLKDAREKCSEVQYTDISFKGEHKNMFIDLTALPAGAVKTCENEFIALIFAEKDQSVEIADSVSYDIDKAASKRISDLEQDLTNVKGKLDRSIAEQECVNEELQAANEELLTANEELQSSNEELQSVNEELYTVNAEYQQKMTELNDLNDDIANFLTSTLTGIIFVDTNLNIRRHTDYVTSEFSVMDHDIGRSLAFVSYHFPSIDITEICTNVLKTLIPDEREVTTSKGKVFFMRVAPYRSTENKITGCVITLMDITSQKQGLATLQHTEKQLSMAQQVSNAKSDYLSHIAKEIHTPMNSLIALAENAKKRYESKSELHTDLDEIINTVNYMNSIVSEISETSETSITEHSSEQPEAVATVADSVNSADTAEFNLSGCNVLIAEDNALNRTILEAMLDNEGITYVETNDGEETVKAFVDAPEHTFSCVLMDMRMPKLDGIKATEAIRASGKADAKEIPIIGVSANGFVDDIKKARTSGVNEYVTKPIDRDKLFTVMSKLIKRK